MPGAGAAAGALASGGSEDSLRAACPGGEKRGCCEQGRGVSRTCTRALTRTWHPLLWPAQQAPHESLAPPSPGPRSCQSWGPVPRTPTLRKAFCRQSCSCGGWANCLLRGEAIRVQVLCPPCLHAPFSTLHVGSGLWSCGAWTPTPLPRTVDLSLVIHFENAKHPQASPVIFASA